MIVGQVGLDWFPARRRKRKVGLIGGGHPPAYVLAHT